MREPAFTALSLLFFFVIAIAAEDIVHLQSTPTCPNGTSLCMYLSGSGCIDLSAGDTCCADGSGICTGGFMCGTGMAGARCCEPESSLEQCAQAVIVGTATSIPPLSTTPPESHGSTAAASFRSVVAIVVAVLFGMAVIRGGHF